MDRGRDWYVSKLSYKSCAVGPHSPETMVVSGDIKLKTMEAILSVFALKK